MGVVWISDVSLDPPSRVIPGYACQTTTRNIYNVLFGTLACAHVPTYAVAWHLQVAPVAAEEFVAVEVRAPTCLVSCLVTTKQI